MLQIKIHTWFKHHEKKKKKKRILCSSLKDELINTV